MGILHSKYLYVIQDVLIKGHHWIILNSMAECFKITHVSISVGLRCLFLGLLRKIKKTHADWLMPDWVRTPGLIMIWSNGWLRLGRERCGWGQERGYSYHHIHKEQHPFEDPSDQSLKPFISQEIPVTCNASHKTELHIIQLWIQTLLALHPYYPSSSAFSSSF